MVLSRIERGKLRLQRSICYGCLVWFAPLFHFLVRNVGGYRIRDLQRVRAEIQQQIQTTQGPLLVCANHLTMIDSMILGVYMFSPWSYFREFRLLPWNVPELSNFGTRFWSRLMCYLGKCVYIERQGSSASKSQTLDKIEFLLRSRELVLIFPEGGRSRSGRIEPDQAAYGVGRLLRKVPNCSVLCLYLRGMKQETYSFFPPRDDDFYLKAKVVVPKTESKGLRADRDLARQVIETLKEMENHYFSERQRNAG